MNVSCVVSYVYDARCYAHLNPSAIHFASAIFSSAKLCHAIEPLSPLSSAASELVKFISPDRLPSLTFHLSSSQVHSFLIALTPSISAARFTSAAPPRLNLSAQVLHFKSSSAASATPPKASMYSLILSSFAAVTRLVPTKVAIARAHFISCDC